MSLLTKQHFDSQVDLPIHLPLTLLPAESWLIVASVGIGEVNPVSAELRWLQLRMVSGIGTVTLGLYKNFNSQVAPSSQAPIELLTARATQADCSNILDSPAFVQRDFKAVLTLTLATPGPGTYSWVVFSSDGAQVTINGGVRLNLNP